MGSETSGVGIYYEFDLSVKDDAEDVGHHLYYAEQERSRNPNEAILFPTITLPSKAAGSRFRHSTVITARLTADEKGI